MVLKIDTRYNNIPNTKASQISNLSPMKQNCPCDTFEISFGKKEEKKSIFKRLFKTYDPQIKIPAQKVNGPVSDFAKSLSEGIRRTTGDIIPAENLINIMSPSEFRDVLPQFKAENFRRDRTKVDDGIYCADLDYQSNYSTGKSNVYDILMRVAEQADTYVDIQREKGVPEEEIKPFYFALSDRDVIEGVQQAIIIIGSDPESFKNVKFIPALKLTYAHPADTSAIGFENSDMLVYGINPFSKNLSTYLENIVEKRKQMVLSFIQDIYNLYPSLKYNVKDFIETNKIASTRGFAVSNLYWRVREYAESKGDVLLKGIHMTPEEILVTASTIFSNFKNVNIGSKQTTLMSPSASTIAKAQNKDFNKSIKSIFEKYSTRIDGVTDTIVSAGENIYGEMIDCLSKEKEKPVLALSAPIYLADFFEMQSSKTFPDVIKFINLLQKGSDGMLCAFQSITPTYGLDPAMYSDRIKLFNNYIRQNTTLYEVGGSFDGVMTN